MPGMQYSESIMRATGVLGGPGVTLRSSKTLLTIAVTSSSRFVVSFIDLLSLLALRHLFFVRHIVC